MSMGANDQRGRAIFDSRGMVGRIYKEDHYKLLHLKYKSSGPCGFGEEDFFMFFQLSPRNGALMDPRGIFYVFPIVCLWEIMTPGEGPFLTPGAWLAGFIKRTTTHCYKQNMKALGLVVSEEIF